jgi:DNA segregation ATPase FtsK/SpoIIIE, S-DNA-T family
MGRKSKKKYSSDTVEKSGIFEHISKETMNAILGVLSMAIAILLLMGAAGIAGRVGTVVYSSFGHLFGIGYFLLPLVLFILSASFFRSREKRFALAPTLGSLLFFFASLGLIALIFKTHGGILGAFLAQPLELFFGPYASAVILFALVVISMLVIFDTSLLDELSRLFSKLFGKKDVVPGGLGAEEGAAIEKAVEKFSTVATDEVSVPAKAPAISIFNRKEKTETEGFAPPLVTRKSGKEWNPPPLSLLEKDKGKPGVGDIKANANIIKRTLLNFGIVVEMDEISIGPSVTRYALKPAEGVKLSKILGLQNNLELALAAHPVRIEAPIPGKSLVGIEVPNVQKSLIGLGSLLSDEKYGASEKPLLVALGKDITGNTQFDNLGKMPHCLVAGATGSGKSVTIHAIINSLLFRNPPDNLKFIMIDPKRVELTLYNGIPHLLTPVITEPKKAILSLKWAGKEMERRYEILERESVRDIDSYHKNILPGLLKKAPNGEQPDLMPYLVIVIDELADLMQAYPRELEAAVVRLAQMSRAVGIHLILSTQRPSVNIITGLIKANIPSRIALQVASQIDSRTILDAAGAEKLLGAGDMLYLSGEMSKPKRIQSAFISEKEVKEVVKYLREAYADELQDEINFTTENTSNAIFSASIGDDEDSFDGDDDDLYEEARAVVLSTKKASTSFLQRKLRIGYARAARLIDILEERGVVGPGSGAKPRDVYSEGGGSVDDTREPEQYDAR